MQVTLKKTSSPNFTDSDTDSDLCETDYDNEASISNNNANRNNNILEFDHLLSTPPNKFTEPDANTFSVRGKTYKRDGIKIEAGPSVFRLITMDFVEVSKPIMSGMTVHPEERLQKALKREEAMRNGNIDNDQFEELPPFVVVINIVMSRKYHLVFYYAVDDLSTINGTDGTPSSKLANRFFFGHGLKSDAELNKFRDKTFKLIPRIIDGNFIVRHAIRSRPAITGRRLNHYYIQTERSFEIVIDTDRTTLASSATKCGLGYASSLVVDMGFVLEGNDESVLPERVFGCVRLKNVDLNSDVRFLDQP